jgi:hypothetical protein
MKDANFERLALVAMDDPLVRSVLHVMRAGSDCLDEEDLLVEAIVRLSGAIRSSQAAHRQALERQIVTHLLHR